MTIPYDPNVQFNSGEPISVDKLTKLQRNIASLKLDLDSRTQSLQSGLAGALKAIPVVPIVYAGSINIALSLSSTKSTKTNKVPINFGGTAFTTTPFLIASISSNLGENAALGCAIRATALSTTGGEIEVFIGGSSSITSVTVHYIAVELKQV